MKKTNVIYWISTGLLVAIMLMSGIMNALVTKDSVEMLAKHMGYPTYIIAFLGVAKILGSIGMLIPGYPRLKEWIYAGFTFDLTGALYSSIASGDPASGWVFMFVFFILIAVSYIYHHKRLKAAVTK
jgi:hypothetical protein